MDMNNCVEFVALTKEEVEEMIAKAALQGRLLRPRRWKRHIRKNRKK